MSIISLFTGGYNAPPASSENSGGAQAPEHAPSNKEAKQGQGADDASESAEEGARASAQAPEETTPSNDAEQQPQTQTRSGATAESAFIANQSDASAARLSEGAARAVAVAVDSAPVESDPVAEFVTYVADVEAEFAESADPSDDRLEAMKAALSRLQNEDDGGAARVVDLLRGDAPEERSAIPADAAAEDTVVSARFEPALSVSAYKFD
jgi:hypothetical protein